MSAFTLISLLYFGITNWSKNIVELASAIPTLFFVSMWAIGFLKWRIIIASLKNIYTSYAPKRFKLFINGVLIIAGSLILYKIITRIYSLVSESFIRIIIAIVIVAVIVWAIWKFVKWHRSLSRTDKLVFSAYFSFFTEILTTLTGRAIRSLN